VLTNLDIITDDLPAMEVDCVYSDPPWGQANLKYWRTKNGEPQAKVDWGAFLDRFFVLLSRHCPSGPWWVETGVRFVDDVIGASPRMCETVVECRYRAGSKWLPNRLLLFGGNCSLRYLSKDLRHGLGLVKWALSVLPPGASVLDPCCGCGMTARACVDLGLHFYGNELNRKRLDRTADILRKAGYDLSGTCST
jgi:hypothetical protein